MSSRPQKNLTTWQHNYISASRFILNGIPSHTGGVIAGLKSIGPHGNQLMQTAQWFCSNFLLFSLQDKSGCVWLRLALNVVHDWYSSNRSVIAVENKRKKRRENKKKAVFGGLPTTASPTIPGHINKSKIIIKKKTLSKKYSQFYQYKYTSIKI